MEGYCTCGAKLLPDSQFCHRCGRPLRDDVGVAEEPEATPGEAVAEVPPVVKPEFVQIIAPAPADISFRNGTAVRVGFLAAAIVQLLMTLAATVAGPIAMPIVLCAGGYYAVFLYRRRTGAGLTVANGARMGWITGVFTFVITTVFFTLGMAALAGSNQLMQAYKESAAGFGLPPDAAAKLQKVMEDPAAFGLSIVFTLILQFFLLTVLCSAGGALCAKLNQNRKV